MHEGGCGLAPSATGEPVLTAPNGKRIPSGPDKRFRGNVFALITGNRRERIEIGAHTLAPYWCGEKMDDALAVEGLVSRDQNSACSPIALAY